MAGYSVEVKGLKEFLAKHDASDKVISSQLHLAMNQAVLDVEAQVKPLVPVGVSGRLRNSIGSQVTGSGASLVGHVGSDMKDEAYPSVMEAGAAPHFPPPDALERWVHLKLQVPTADAPHLAYLIARKIARAGIKGRFYLRDGFEKAKDKVHERFNVALAKIVAEMSRRS